MPKDAKNQTAARSLASAAEVTRAIADLTRFYRIGAKSLRKYRDRMAHGKMAEEAQAAGVNPETLRKARVCADARRGGYSEADFRELIDLIRDHRTAIGPSHIIKLITVKDKKMRAQLQRAAVARGWSLHDLDSEIRLRFGKRRAGVGRKPRKVGTADEACYELVRIVQKLQNLCRGLREPDGADGGRPPLLQELTPLVRAKIEAVEAAIGHLHDALLRRVPEELSPAARERAQVAFMARLAARPRRRIDRGSLS